MSNASGRQYTILTIRCLTSCELFGILENTSQIRRVGPGRVLPSWHSRRRGEADALRAQGTRAQELTAGGSPGTPPHSVFPRKWDTDNVFWLEKPSKNIGNARFLSSEAFRCSVKGQRRAGPGGPRTRPRTVALLPDSPGGRAGARQGHYLRPGWLLPARMRRTLSGRPSRQLSAVDTRRICPPCKERRSSGAAARQGTARPSPARLGAHPLHDAAVYLHPVPVHGWQPVEPSLAEAPAVQTGSGLGPEDSESAAEQRTREEKRSAPPGAGACAGRRQSRRRAEPPVRSALEAVPLREAPPGPTARAQRRGRGRSLSAPLMGPARRRVLPGFAAARGRRAVGP